MAHIVEFEISGLAGRKGVYGRKLNRDVNVFFGVNGSGKTSLLKILHGAMQNDAAVLVNVPFSSARVVVYSRDFDKEFVYTVDKENLAKEFSQMMEMKERVEELRRLPTRMREECHLDWQVKPRLPEVASKRWRHRYLPTTRLFRMARFPYSDMERLFEDEDFLDMQFESSLERLWLDMFGEMQANVRQSQQKALVDILNEVLATKAARQPKKSLLDWETAYDEMVSFLKRQNPKAKPSAKESFRKRYHETPLLRKVVGRIDRVEREIDTWMAPRTKLQNLVQRLFTAKTLTFGETSIEILTQQKGKISLRSLSSGEKQLLYLLLAVTEVGESSIIIDEPEISMHVDWQRELISAMRELNSQTQIIAATHSPEIIAEIEDSKIFKL